MATDKRSRGYRWQQLCKRLEAEYAMRHGGIIQCHLCGLAIDRNAAKGEPSALTWDHIEPRSQRPDLELVPDNIRPADALCNSMRRDRPLAEIIGTDELRVLWHRQRNINVQRQKLRKDREAATGTPAPVATGRYVVGTDYPPFSPMTGIRRPDTSKVRPYYNPTFAPWGDEPPYDEWTGLRRPGVEWPIGSGDFG
ncbi:HNH endonuclease [Rhodococcus opacus]|uniref:HNH endonuclease n=1 Tax=Rhodococcus opacus TaxID=37919 RepID=A0AAX3Y8J9_RHOOP|nr:HNH endonuclease [Rhodococcus opacus]MCZ4586472.1 HNH endonuclease [Rhodococcus opacus]WLF45040.1 HNH endonuclease [Rhodococcus opacus]